MKNCVFVRDRVWVNNARSKLYCVAMGKVVMSMAKNWGDISPGISPLILWGVLNLSNYKTAKKKKKNYGFANIIRLSCSVTSEFTGSKKMKGENLNRRFLTKWMNKRHKKSHNNWQRQEVQINKIESKKIFEQYIVVGKEEASYLDWDQTGVGLGETYSQSWPTMQSHGKKNIG